MALRLCGFALDRKETCLSADRGHADPIDPPRSRLIFSGAHESDIEDATESSLQRSARDSRNASARFGLTWALFYAGDLEGAEEQCMRGLEIAPLNTEVRLSLATIYHHEGRVTDEISELRRVLLMRLGSVEATQRLSRLAP